MVYGYYDSIYVGLYLFSRAFEIIKHNYKYIYIYVYFKSNEQLSDWTLKKQREDPDTETVNMKTIYA